MSHIPLYGFQTKAQRLSTLAKEISRAGGVNAYVSSIAGSRREFSQASAPAEQPTQFPDEQDANASGVNNSPEHRRE